MKCFKPVLASWVLSCLLGMSAIEANGAPGPAGPSGPARMGPGAGGPGPHAAPGPRRGHGLPDGARELWIGSMLYFFAAGTYYLWNTERDRYEPAPAPAVGASYDVIAYPTRGQTDEQQARDRYECHGWAVQQSGFDPARAQGAPAEQTADRYRRALSACLQGRYYSVQ